MEWFIEQILSGYGKRMLLLHIHLLCCSQVIVEQHKQSALNIFLLNKQEKTVSRYQVTVQDRPTIAT